VNGDDNQPTLAVKVWGDFACFTRPEMKVERVSYPLPTPSGASGVLEAIFWKPEFVWRIKEIWVLNPIRYFSILRNEVTGRASERAAASWQKSGGGYDAPANRSQRHSLALRDVAYVFKAQIEVKQGVEADVAKYRDQFRRRVKGGRCFSTPYLGCREFSAHFAPLDGTEKPIKTTEHLGAMLHSLDYAADGSGRGTPRFFDASLENGVLYVPALSRGADRAAATA